MIDIGGGYMSLYSSKDLDKINLETRNPPFKGDIIL